MTEQWGVTVDECGLFAIGGPGADWWASFLTRMWPTGRIVELDLSMGGGLFHAAYDDKADAEQGREFMVGRGLHSKCVKVTTLAAARKSVRRSHSTSTRYEPGHSCRYCTEAVAS
ncbi:hypothetical protein [Nocardia wallacei]|uniref:hypothetical protein n=1 Tax=Nocardia wallacei TaxID=480035 RepID=UPI002456E5E5|nr:hypothetical protein [Nocardia wallacei]